MMSKTDLLTESPAHEKVSLLNDRPSCHRSLRDECLPHGLVQSLQVRRAIAVQHAFGMKVGDGLAKQGNQLRVGHSDGELGCLFIHAEPSIWRSGLISQVADADVRSERW